MVVRTFHCGLSWCWGAGPASRHIAPILDDIIRELSERHLAASGKDKISSVQFVEPFGSYPSMVFALRAWNAGIVNDLNHGQDDFGEVLQDPKLILQFQSKINAWGPGPEPGQWDFADRSIWWQSSEISAESALVNRAYQFYCVSRAALPNDSIRSSTKLRARAIARNHHYLTDTSRLYPESALDPATVDALAELLGRFDGIQWDHRSWRNVIEAFDRPYSLFFVAPDTYFSEHKGIAAKHARLLVDSLLHLRGKAVIFGRERVPYARLEAAGWEKRKIDWFPPCPPNPHMFQVYKVWGILKGRKPHLLPRFVWIAPL